MPSGCSHGECECEALENCQHVSNGWPEVEMYMSLPSTYTNQKHPFPAR